MDRYAGAVAPGPTQVTWTEVARPSTRGGRTDGAPSCRGGLHADWTGSLHVFGMHLGTVKGVSGDLRFTESCSTEVKFRT